MNDICRLFFYVALSACYKKDLDTTDGENCDYIIKTLHRIHPDDMVAWRDFYPSYRYNFLFVRPRADGFAMTVELKNELIVVCLGTDGSDEWKADTGGWFNSWKGLMHSGYGNAAEATYKCVSHIIERCKWVKPVTVVGHSQGSPEACGVAYLAKKRLGVTCGVFAYNPPPGFTKKGVRAYNKLGLDETTVNIFAAKNDIVGIAGEWKYDHVGSSTNLPEAKDEFMQNIPIAGGHSYRSVFASLEQYAKEIKDQDAIDWIEKTKGVATI